MVKGKKAEVESIRGGEDLWDAASAAQQGSFPEHLVVMVNGLIGRLLSSCSLSVVASLSVALLN